MGKYYRNNRLHYIYPIIQVGSFLVLKDPILSAKCKPRSTHYGVFEIYKIILGES